MSMRSNFFAFSVFVIFASFSCKVDGLGAHESNRMNHLAALIKSAFANNHLEVRLTQEMIISMSEKDLFVLLKSCGYHMLEDWENSGEVVDLRGNAYEIRFEFREGKRTVIVVSSGLDGKLFTRDDLSVEDELDFPFGEEYPDYAPKR